MPFSMIFFFICSFMLKLFHQVQACNCKAGHRELNILNCMPCRLTEKNVLSQRLTKQVILYMSLDMPDSVLMVNLDSGRLYL